MRFPVFSCVFQHFPVFEWFSVFLGTQLKAFADKKFHIAKIIISVFDSAENFVGKGVRAGYKHFLLSHYLFKRFFFQGPLTLKLPNDKM